MILNYAYNLCTNKANFCINNSEKQTNNLNNMNCQKIAPTSRTFENTFISSTYNLDANCDDVYVTNVYRYNNAENSIYLTDDVQGMVFAKKYIALLRTKTKIEPSCEKR